MVMMNLKEGKEKRERKMRGRDSVLYIRDCQIEFFNSEVFQALGEKRSLSIVEHQKAQKHRTPFQVRISQGCGGRESPYQALPGKGSPSIVEK